jgi:hypothetical protein
MVNNSQRSLGVRVAILLGWVLALLVVAYLCSVYVWNLNAPEADASQIHISHLGGQGGPLRELPSPLRFENRRLSKALYPERVISRTVERLRPSSCVPLPELLHAIRVFGPDMPVNLPGRSNALPECSNAVRAIDVILDHSLAKLYFGGDVPLISTRDGVRCEVVVRRDSARLDSREAHSGQLLAVLAESGISLSTPLTTAMGQFQVRDILNDLSANFTLRQSELEWTAVAFALYLPPQRQWTDKFGAHISFDDLAEALLSAPMDGPGVACQGTHVLHALTVMYLADIRKPIFSATKRAAVHDRLAHSASAAVSLQAASGEWAPAGQSAPDDARAIESSVLTRRCVTLTGHNLEWMTLLPDSMAPPEAVVQHAMHWIKDELDSAKLSEIKEAYCPYSHCARMLDLLSQP